MKNWFFKLFKKVQPKVHVEQETEVTPEINNHVEQPAPVFEIKITTKPAEEHDEGETTTIFSHLDFNNSVEGLGRFLNYQKYRVIGKSEKGRRKTEYVVGMDSQEAIEKATDKGLIPPFELEILEHEPPTERQIACLERNGIIYPDGITKYDASCLLSRAFGDDSEESPEPYLVALATGLKIKFSAFIGAKGLLSDIIYSSGRNRAALYAYAVSQSMGGRSFGNMLEDPKLSLFYAFADQVIEDPALMRSLRDRPIDDFKKPYRGTAIYKAAAAFLTSEMNKN